MTLVGTCNVKAKKEERYINTITRSNEGDSSDIIHFYLAFLLVHTEKESFPDVCCVLHNTHLYPAQLTNGFPTMHESKLLRGSRRRKGFITMAEKKKTAQQFLPPSIVSDLYDREPCQTWHKQGHKTWLTPEKYCIPPENEDDRPLLRIDDRHGRMA